MAPHGAHHAVLTGRSAAGEYNERETIGLGRKSTVNEAFPTSSKIPTSSWFSRGKQNQTKYSLSEIANEKPRELSGRRMGPVSTGAALSSESQGLGGHGLGISPFTSSSSAFSTRQEPRQRNVLRRKTASADQRGRYARTESSSASSHGPTPARRQYETASTPGAFSSSASGSILGLALPTASTSTSYLPSTTIMNPDQATSSSRMAVYLNRKVPQTLSTHNLPPPTPSFAQSSGSSTRRSESPGSLSRTSTPTSMSSYSPSIPHPMQSPLKTRQTSPTRSRPPVTRWRIKQDDVDVDTRGLAAVRESITSSSSSSTVKGTERSDNNHSRQTTHRLSPPPPSPPLRAIPKEVQSTVEKAAQQKLKIQADNPRQIRHGPVNQEEDIYRTRSSNSSSHKLTSPPPRPSREGTPKLDGYIAPSPVIHSNLSRIGITGHKRRESLERAAPGNEAPVTGRNLLARSSSNASAFSARPSRLPSPNPATIHTGSGRPSQPRLTNETIKSRKVSLVEPVSVTERITKDPGLLNASSSKSSTRFGLFSRRPRSPTEPSGSESGDRAHKKGPVAGTGHEGYGKYAKRGRSGSMSTSASRGRSTSTSGTASSSIARTPISRNSSVTSRDEPDMDDFLLERLAPVFISGGGLADHRASRPAIHQQSSGESSSSVVASDIRYTGQLPVVALDYSPDSAANEEVEEARRLRRESRSILHGHGHASGLDMATGTSGFDSFQPSLTLAARRSLHRSQLLKEMEPAKMPAPINTHILAPSPMGSRDTVLKSGRTTDSTVPLSDEISEGREGNWLKPKRAGKRTRSPRKWNFFQRALASPKKSTGHGWHKDPNFASELPAAVSMVSDSRPLPYYAMLDASEQEDLRSTPKDTMIDRTMQNDFGVPLGLPEVTKYEHSPPKQGNKLSVLLPSPPTYPAEFANTHHVHAQTKAELLRQPEVAPVSEPASTETPKPRVPRLQQIGRIPRVVSKRDRLHNPPPQSFSRPFARSTPRSNPAVPNISQHFGSSQLNPLALVTDTETVPSNLWEHRAVAEPAIAPVLAQEANEASHPVNPDEFLIFPSRKFSEISASSSSGSGSFAAAIATTAIVPEPNTAPGEDEVWNEYNDFLDTVESPAPLSETTVSEREHLRKTARMTPAPLYIRKDLQSDDITTTALSTKDIAAAHGLPSPPPMSKLLAPRHSAESALSPLSFSEFFAGYADRNRISAASKHKSNSSGSRYSTDSIIDLEGYGQGKRHTQIMAEKTEGTSSTQSNLRFSALMTSRWLSFGRVLFSPAHDEMNNHRQVRILVLDGLGNDDWSFYCALTYPNAIIYNISPVQTSGSASVKKREAGAYDSPSNHRQIYHTSIAHPFPFPKGFFTAAVFRFPVASSETAYANAIAEFKRVLQPGGYLELSILDLDMVNMGNRARHAVRQLKVSMQQNNPDVSLKPNSDNIQKMLGRRGFENLKSCMVDVPVAGAISSSRAGSFDSKDMSLGDMLNDSSARGDESITKMVSKVGRWWYTRCYETSLSLTEDSATKPSMWNDKQLLRECEKRETGLKLLICHAQKPINIKRRTASM